MSTYLRTSSLRSRTRLVRAWSTVDISVIGGGDKLAYDWLTSVAAADGTLTANTEALVYALANAVMEWPGNRKVLYFLPLIGGNLAAARIPLIDRCGGGVAQNLGFTEAAYTEATGLTGTGGNRFDFEIKSSVIIGFYGGCGLLYGLRDYGTKATSSYSLCTYRSTGSGCFGLLDTSANVWAFSCGASPSTAPRWSSTGVAPAADTDYYMQDTTGTRTIEVYRNGVAASVTNTDYAAETSTETNLGLLGNSGAGSTYWSKDRVGAMAVTTGKLTPTEVAELHTILQDYLYTPTGR